MAPDQEADLLSLEYKAVELKNKDKKTGKKQIRKMVEAVICFPIFIGC